MYICKQCQEKVEIYEIKVIDLNILHLECVNVYKSDQERLLREMAEIRENTQRKWEELGFLEGPKTQLYESKSSYIINEE